MLRCSRGKCAFQMRIWLTRFFEDITGVASLILGKFRHVRDEGAAAPVHQRPPGVHDLGVFRKCGNGSRPYFAGKLSRV